MSSKDILSKQPNNLENDSRNCKIRMFGIFNIAECLSEAIHCEMAVPFGGGRICNHTSARQFIIVVQPMIEEAIKLELNVAEIYFSFHHRFHEDASFWWQLAVEEKNHALLLRNVEQNFLNAGMFPSELVGNSLEALINANSELKTILRQVKGGNPPSRASALNLALKLEELAGEIHFQHAMQQVDPPSEAIKLFQSLNEDDKDHADRIRNYMRQNGIEITCN